MVDLTEAQFLDAEARGLDVLSKGPRAAAARYDPASGLIIVDLCNRCLFAFPARLVQDLQGAGQPQLSEVEVDGSGLNLHWPALDVDLQLSALMAGVFGTAAWIADEQRRGAFANGTAATINESGPTASRRRSGG